MGLLSARSRGWNAAVLSDGRCLPARPQPVLWVAEAWVRRLPLLLCVSTAPDTAFEDGRIHGCRRGAGTVQHGHTHATTGIGASEPSLKRIAHGTLSPEAST
jgi:hypothetical protein